MPMYNGGGYAPSYLPYPRGGGTASATPLRNPRRQRGRGRERGPLGSAAVADPEGFGGASSQSLDGARNKVYYVSLCAESVFSTILYNQALSK